jgi:hypothetical protein
VNLESRDIIEIGGQPAIRRVFSMPASNIHSELGHFLQVYIMKGLALYQFTGGGSTNALTQHRAEIEYIITSMQFSP